MDYEFDPDKDRLNRIQHGIGLSEAGGFEWDTAVVREDRRYDYDEQRFEATGFIGNDLYVMPFCWRGEVVRVISLRRADNREKRNYVRAFS
ncbi:MAG: BrnT family toxin [Azonexus sp.]|nr:BrnT family toxin [Azonexus sp.]